jgi:hypothetical protein
MIEDVIAYLKADTTLAGLVGTRLYPDEAPKDPVKPYMVYRTQSAPGRTKGNQVNEEMLGFSIFAVTALIAKTIERQLDVLLDKDAGINIPSTTYHIKSCWRSGGSSMFEQDTKLHHRPALYTLLYR